MLVETLALFSVEEDTPLIPDDQIIEITGEVVMQGETKLYPTPFCFDTKDLVCFNKSQHEGYTAIRIKHGFVFTVKNEYKEVVNWVKS